MQRLCKFSHNNVFTDWENLIANTLQFECTAQKKYICELSWRMWLKKTLYVWMPDAFEINI